MFLIETKIDDKISRKSGFWMHTAYIAVNNFFNVGASKRGIFSVLNFSVYSWGTLWQHLFSLFFLFHLKLMIQMVLFHLMVYLDMVSVGTMLFFIPKSFKLFLNSFSKLTAAEIRTIHLPERSQVYFRVAPVQKSSFVRMRKTIAPAHARNVCTCAFLLDHSHLLENKRQCPVRILDLEL